MNSTATSEPQALKARVVVDDLYYDLEPSALEELQGVILDAQARAARLDNAPPDYSTLMHRWIIDRMERNDPRVTLVS